MKTEKSRTPSIAAARAIVQRVDALNWEKIEDDLDVFGSAVIPHLLTEQECEALASLYPREDIYRTRIVMARHGFGKGEYKYFDYPLPDILAGLRTGIYPHLVPMANRWNQAMRIGVRYPERHADFIETCHAGKATITAFIRTFTASTCSLCKLQCCCLNLVKISQAANL
jgi:hypothetical protein